MASKSGDKPADTAPLCVDLDGTLIRTDLLAESILALVKRAPFYALVLPIWLLGGRARLKRRVAERVRLDAKALPYEQEVLDYLRSERARGRELYLATASDELLARPVAEHLGLFDGVLASDGRSNLKGERKLRAVEERLAGRPFSYIGDAREDLALWRRAEQAFLVRPSPALLEEARANARVSRVFGEAGDRRIEALRAIRPHQWVKNLLLFVPLVTGHQLEESDLLGDALLAFLSFSLCASSVYVLNDLLDLGADRRHPVKRQRPFAAGSLPLSYAPALIFGLLAGSAALAAALPRLFGAAIAVYYATTLAYSLRLKHAFLLDVFCLAGLYTLRIFAGHSLSLERIPFSPWLLTFSMFIFLSLALLKRYADLLLLGPGREAVAQERDYGAGDLLPLMSLGTTSGYISVLVFALYINSEQVQLLYRRPMLLWLICPLILYWISRLWFLAQRGCVRDEPVVFTLKDRVSYLTGAVIAALLAAASR